MWWRSSGWMDSSSSICFFLFLTFFAPDSASLHVFIMPALRGAFWFGGRSLELSLTQWLCVKVCLQCKDPDHRSIPDCSRTNNSEGTIRKVRANGWEAVTHSLQWKLVQTLDKDKKYIYCSDSNVSLYLNLCNRCSTLFSYEVLCLML